MLKLLFSLTFISSLSFSYDQNSFDTITNDGSNAIPFSCVTNVFKLSNANKPECFKITDPKKGMVWFACNPNLTEAKYMAILARMNEHNLNLATIAPQNTEITTENTSENSSSTENKEDTTQTAE